MIDITVTFLTLALSCTLCLIPNDPKEPLPILNMANIPEKLPRNFRMANGPFHPHRLTFPTRVGLDQLYISGSGQFSEEGYEAIYKHVGEPRLFLDIDLRQESHGFINGNAISWYSPKDWANRNKSSQEILNDQKLRFDLIKKDKSALIFKVISKTSEGAIHQADAFPLLVSQVDTEENFVKQQEHLYQRFYIADHTRPKDEDVDYFVAFVTKLAPQTWIHFHCAAGDGRTTTFMVMRDMMVNSHQVSFEDIIHRQWLLGGIDLSSMPHESNWKFPYALERLEFLRKFYDYTKVHSKNNFQTPWSEYIRAYAN